MINSYRELPFYIRFCFILLMLILVAFIIYAGQDIIVPFAFAVLLSVLLLPVNTKLEKYKVPRVIAILISLTISVIFIAAILYFLTTQIAGFMSDIPSIKQHLETHLQTLQHWLNDTLNLSGKQQDQIINNATLKLKDSGTGMIGYTFLSITQALAFIFLIPVYSFLLLYYRDMIRRFLIDICKDEHEAKVHEILKESRLIVQSYMVGLIIEMFIVAAMNAAGFIIIGVQYAVLLGVVAAILNMIPYIGGIIAMGISMVVTLTTSQNISDIIWVGIILTVVQFIDNNILMPKVVSSKVKINALISILGVLIGGALAGVSGMFLSIPGIAILKVIFDRIDDVKPWGMLMGDEITPPKKGDIYKQIKKIRSGKKLIPADANPSGKV